MLNYLFWYLVLFMWQTRCLLLGIEVRKMTSTLYCITELNIIWKFCTDGLSTVTFGYTNTRLFLSLWIYESKLSGRPELLGIGKTKEVDCGFEAGLVYKERPRLRKQTDERSQASKQIRIYALTVAEVYDGACISGNGNVVCLSKHNFSDCKHEVDVKIRHEMRWEFEAEENNYKWVGGFHGKGLEKLERESCNWS